MGVKVVATDFLGREFERELSVDDLQALYCGDLNFREIVKELFEKACADPKDGD